jgi:hypothetical protein
MRQLRDQFILDDRPVDAGRILALNDSKEPVVWRIVLYGNSAFIPQRQYDKKVGWRGGISPPRSHGSGRDSLPPSGSYHPAARLTERFYLIPWLLPSLVDQTIRPDDPTPSLHSHYRNFHTTTSWSVPVPRIGTLILVVSST